MQTDLSESAIQSSIFYYYWNNYCLPIHSPRQMIYHVPNQRQLGLSNIGLYAGVADLTIIHNCTVYQVEVKEPNKGKQSPNQIKFQNHCQQSNIQYFIVTSLEEFKKLPFLV